MLKKYFIIYNIIDIIIHIINTTLLAIVCFSYRNNLDNNEIFIVLFLFLLFLMFVFKLIILIIHIFKSELKDNIIIEHINIIFTINMLIFTFLIIIYYFNYNSRIYYKTLYYLFISSTINICVIIYLYDNILYLKMF